jgi:membrane-associated phospholipid phosphatase
MKAESLFPRSGPGRALAHTPHRSDGRPPHTPRGARQSGPLGRPGAFPPVPGRPVFLLGAVLFLLFLFLSWQVVSDGPLTAADRALRTASSCCRSPGAPTAVAQAAADLGNGVVAGGTLAAGALLLAARRRSWLPPLVAVAALAVVPLLVLPLKAAFARPGPDGLPLGDYPGYYPSGHAVTAAVAYGTLALLCRGRAPRAAAAVAVLATGVGLVLRQYHWATDVLAGWALSGVVLCALARGTPLIAARLTSRRPGAAPTPRGERPPGRRDQ